MDIEQALQRIKELEAAIRKADDCLGQSEGIGLLRYMGDDSEEAKLVAEVLEAKAPPPDITVHCFDPENLRYIAQGLYQIADEFEKGNLKVKDGGILFDANYSYESDYIEIIGEPQAPQQRVLKSASLTSSLRLERN